MSIKIRDYMTEMPHTIGQDLPLQRAEEMMSRFKCRHLPVLEGGHLVGVLSERDLNLLLGNNGNAKVSEAMTDEPFVVDPEADLKTVAKQMLERRYGSAIVRAKDGKPWGIFTLSDALRVIIDRL